MTAFYAICCPGYPLSCCIVLVPHFDWKRRFLINNWIFYICTFEIYCKFIHFFDDTFFELFSLDNVRYFLNNKLKRCFYMGFYQVFDKFSKFSILASPNIRIRSLSSFPLSCRRKGANSTGTSKCRSVGAGI